MTTSVCFNKDCQTNWKNALGGVYHRETLSVSPGSKCPYCGATTEKDVAFAMGQEPAND